MLNERFERLKDFEPRKYLGTSIGVMAGEGDYQVVIEMDAWLTDVLRGRRWHQSQVLEEVPGGGSHLTMRLSCLEEIEQYVLSWWTHATVIGPEELRKRVANVAREVAGGYAEKASSYRITAHRAEHFIESAKRGKKKPARKSD